MNWLLILVVLLWAFYIVRGYKRGMLRMLYSLVSWIVILILVTWATPYVADFIAQNTTFETDIQETSHEKLRELVLGTDESSDEDTNKKALEALGLKLPEELVDAVVGDQNIADNFFETTGLYEQISEKIASLALTGVSFVLCLIIVIIASHILYSLIKVVEDVPVVGSINKILGIVLGSIKGLFIVWTAFAIIAMNGVTQTGLMLTSYIYESLFLTWIYENNFVLTILLRFL